LVWGSDNPKDGQTRKLNKKMVHLSVGFMTGNIQDALKFVNVTETVAARVVPAAVFLYGMKSGFINALAVKTKGSLEWI